MVISEAVVKMCWGMACHMRQSSGSSGGSGAECSYLCAPRWCILVFVLVVPGGLIPGPPGGLLGCQ